MALAVFLALALVSAVVWHLMLERFWPAAMAATMTTVLGFQALAWLQAGQLDPFAPVAVLVSLLPALVVAAVAGLVARMVRIMASGGGRR